MKTQVLNTVFTANAGPMAGEINKLVSNVGNAMSSAAGRAQAIMNASRTMGMTPEGVQKAGRMEEMTGVEGLSASLARMSQQHALKMDAGVNVALKRMGIDKNVFWKADEINRTMMIGRGMAEKPLREQWTIGSMLGNRDAWMKYAGQMKEYPKQSAVIAAQAATDTVSEPVVKFWEGHQMRKRIATSSLKAGFKSILAGEPFVRPFTTVPEALNEMGLGETLINPVGGFKKTPRQRQPQVPLKDLETDPLTRMIGYLEGIFNNTRELTK